MEDIQKLQKQVDKLDRDLRGAMENLSTQTRESLSSQDESFSTQKEKIASLSDSVEKNGKKIDRLMGKIDTLVQLQTDVKMIDNRLESLEKFQRGADQRWNKLQSVYSTLAECVSDNDDNLQEHGKTSPYSY